MEVVELSVIAKAVVAATTTGGIIEVRMLVMVSKSSSGLLSVLVRHTLLVPSLPRTSFQVANLFLVSQ